MMNEFGIRLKSARKMAGMSLDALARERFAADPKH